MKTKSKKVQLAELEVIMRGDLKNFTKAKKERFLQELSHIAGCKPEDFQGVSFKSHSPNRATKKKK